MIAFTATIMIRSALMTVAAQIRGSIRSWSEIRHFAATSLIVYRSRQVGAHYTPRALDTKGVSMPLRQLAAPSCRLCLHQFCLAGYGRLFTADGFIESRSQFKSSKKRPIFHYNCPPHPTQPPKISHCPSLKYNSRFRMRWRIVIRKKRGKNRLKDRVVI